MKPQFESYLTKVERHAVNEALKHGLPCVPHTYARSEMVGLQGGFLNRLPFIESERVLIAGDAFGLLTEAMLKEDPTRHVTIWEACSELHAFAQSWFSNYPNNVQLRYQPWHAYPPLEQQTTVLILWEYPFLVSDMTLQSMVQTLHSFVQNGGRVCIRHTSPQYLEQYPDRDQLLRCPIRHFSRAIACANFSLMKELALTLECQFRSISSIHDPKMFLTVLML